MISLFPVDRYVNAVLGSEVFRSGDNKPLIELLADVVSYADPDGLDVCGSVSSKFSTTINGIIRPTRRWDFVATSGDELRVVIAVQRLTRSVGNNLNNRLVESLGQGIDLKLSLLEQGLDPREIFTGYLLVMENSEETASPIPSKSNSRSLLPDRYDGLSYLRKADLSLMRMSQKGIWSHVGLITIPNETSTPFFSEISLHNFVDGLVEFCNQSIS